MFIEKSFIVLTQEHPGEVLCNQGVTPYIIDSIGIVY